MLVRISRFEGAPGDSLPTFPARGRDGRRVNDAQAYGIDRWGSGYFRVSGAGRVEATPFGQAGDGVDLGGLALRAREAGLGLPVLFRFVDILHDRVNRLRLGFERAAAGSGHTGGYCALYPVKVNQQRSVVEEILAAPGACVGLEAGSKTELMAVLAISPPGGTIVCNGYKDREYIRLALIGQRLGQRVFIVLEKPSELDLVLQEAVRIGVEPSLGVRVRLSSSGSGNWQNAGGERSKFGLSASQLLAMTARLERHGALHWLKLLHTHIGSQIPNLGDIRQAMAEAARFYAALHGRGARIEVVDVGGGLAVDYEGTGTRHACSMNYSVESYFTEIVQALARVCTERGLPHPELFSESGRAITAHHAVLITNVIGTDPAPDDAGLPPVETSASDPLRRLARELERAVDAPPTEVYHEARQGLEEVRRGFVDGRLPLADRARAEQLFHATCRRLKPRLTPPSRRHRELLDLLNERLADRVFCNFSIFQSLPDVWAIEQIFPVLPLAGLDQAPDASAVLYDLTCDSDGMIGNYVVEDGVEHSLPVHGTNAREGALIGVFLVGAYQEILGDMHNLFGDTNAVNVVMDAAAPDGYRLCQPERGDSIDELLRYVHFDPEEMVERYRGKLQAQGVRDDERDWMFEELRAGLFGYSYLEE